LPRDVLTTLLRNHDRLDLHEETVLREVAYFPWVGSHSTSNAFVHAMHHMFAWIREHPDEQGRLVSDPLRRQQFVHETLRLHPASPVAVRRALGEVALPSGQLIATGDRVVIHVAEANRDPSVFGPSADRFEPGRELPEGVAPWGLSFGHGPHACLGQELAAGLEPHSADEHLFGAITVMSGVMLAAGAHPDTDDPATLDTSTTRHVWARYPVLLGAPG
jgi:cytochrome P450